MPAERILLLRHAEGEHNLLEMLHLLSPGDFDERMSRNQWAQLTEKGKTQAEEAAERLKTMEIHKVFVSPFDRTVDTAKPYLEALGIEASVMVELSEILPSPVPGNLLKEEQALPAFVYFGLGFAQKLLKANSPGVPETVLGAWNRVGAAFWRLTQEEGTVLAVTHGGVVGAMSAHALMTGHWEVPRFTLENAGITEFVRKR